MDTILSPTEDKFSTPPSTPGLVAPAVPAAHTLSRKNSRPSSLTIDQSKRTSWNPDVVLESPEGPNGISPKTARGDQHQKPPSSIPSRLQAPHHAPAMKSPCFVHSHLDKGASLADWLRTKQQDALGTTLSAFDESTPSISKNGGSAFGLSRSSSMTDSIASDDEDYGGGSLTKQLAATAVGVREMSKQLGRARVRSNIKNVLIITKARDNRLIQLTHDLALYLMLKPRNGERGLVVYVDNQLRTSRRFDAEGIERDHPELFVPFPRRRSSSSTSLASMSSHSIKDDFQLKEEGQLRYWTSDMCSNSPHLFDFVVTLGGDGTVLFTSWLFQRIVPPVLPFALGSLGFLTNFDFADHQAVMDTALDNGIRVNLRMRFTCTVYRAVAIEEGKGRKAVKKGETGEIMMKNVEKGGWEALEGGWTGSNNAEAAPGKAGRDKEIMCFTTRPVETFEILNDLVVDRGPSPYVSLLELFGDEHHMTTVQADGLTVSTPTGSTAYSLSAGGSLVHPEIPALLITPICPHTLSFRPMLLPDSMELRICVPFNSRSTAWASFDGRGRVELKQGDHIKVTASKYPFPTVCADKQSTDWFNAISRTLKWNERERQKSFVVVEEGPAKHKRRSSKHTSPTPEPVEEMIEDEEEDEVSDEEEEDKFDIDDSSPEAAAAAAAAELAALNEASQREQTLGKAKAREGAAELAARALSESNPFVNRARQRSRSGVRSGVETPDRFAGPYPHPPKISPRHVEFLNQSNSSSSESLHIADEQRGTRDDIHSPRSAVSSNRSRIPKDRDVEAESMKTPTVGEGSRGRGENGSSRKAHRRRPASTESYHAPRAFAVWGQDESDSNASDSDA